MYTFLYVFSNFPPLAPKGMSLFVWELTSLSKQLQISLRCVISDFSPVFLALLARSLAVNENHIGADLLGPDRVCSASREAVWHGFNDKVGIDGLRMIHAIAVFYSLVNVAIESYKLQIRASIWNAFIYWPAVSCYCTWCCTGVFTFYNVKDPQIRCQDLHCCLKVLGHSGEILILLTTTSI